MGARASRFPGPWYGEFGKRLKFEGSVRERFPQLPPGQHSRAPGRRGWWYRTVLPVEHYEERNVEILFAMPYPKVPRVFVDGPESRHRYADGALCMWHPVDPPDRRWHFDEGLEILLGHIIVHLFREAWWHEYGEWLGDEAPHGELSTAKEGTRRRAA